MPTTRPYDKWPCPACHMPVTRTLKNRVLRAHLGRLGEDRGDGWCPGTGFDPDAPAQPQLKARGLA